VMIQPPVSRQNGDHHPVAVQRRFESRQAIN